MTSALETGDPLGSAVAAGLVSAREAAGGGVAVDNGRLLLNGRPIADAVTRAEARSLGLLAGTGLVPELAEGHQQRWAMVVRGTPLTTVTGSMGDLAACCQAWGATLATLHLVRIGAGGDPPVAPRPWVLDPDRLPRGMRQAPAGSARAYVLRTVRSDRGLLRTVEGVADHWATDHWTHGDLTADRVLVQTTPDVRVRFVDLSSGGLGDAGWDLAGALETVAALTAGPWAPWGSASGACLTDYLLQGYRRAGGVASPSRGVRALRIVSRAWDAAVALDATSAHPASLHPASGYAAEATRLTERLAAARELAHRSARLGLVAA